MLFSLFWNSGKPWSFCQLVASRLKSHSFAFHQIVGYTFSSTYSDCFENSLRNFLPKLLFADNVKEKGSGGKYWANKRELH